MFDKLIYKQFGSWLKLINSWIRGRPSFSLIAIERNSEVAIYKKEINIVWCGEAVRSQWYKSFELIIFLRFVDNG